MNYPESVNRTLTRCENGHPAIYFDQRTRWCKQEANYLYNPKAKCPICFPNDWKEHDRYHRPTLRTHSKPKNKK